MKGSYRVVVKNAKMHYDFVVNRNITVICGNSATGKSTLIDMIREYDNSPKDSGINLSCQVPCTVIGGRKWKTDLASIHGSIVFVDENNDFLPSHEFAASIRDTDNYYVLVTREDLPNLPYSVDEIY